MRDARARDAAPMEFLVGSDEAAADRAKRDRKALECAMDEAGKVRAL